MARPGKQHLRICVANLQQRPDLAAECRFVGNVVAYLNVYFLTAFHGHEINFFLIKFPDIYFVSSP